jgi:2-dehydro-3-deoxyphosphogluconate aldolase/(4S)-4-hydroxy-2-oxoglutarate aldolase
MGTFDVIREARLIAVVTAPEEDKLFQWATAVAKGGVRLLGIPSSMSTVTEITSDLADEAGLCVGVAGVITNEQLSVAVVAGAQFVICPFADPDLIGAARHRNLTVIASAATPTEIARCAMLGPDFICASPISAFGGHRYMAWLRAQFPALPLIAGGDIGIDEAPAYLEAGAAAVIVDRGLFPSEDDAAALEVITMRAQALSEVCAPTMNVDLYEDFG